MKPENDQIVELESADLVIIGLPAVAMKRPIILAAGTAAPTVTNVTGTLEKVGGGAGPYAGTKIVPAVATPGCAVWGLLFSGITITGEYELRVQVTSGAKTHSKTVTFDVE